MDMSKHDALVRLVSAVSDPSEEYIQMQAELDRSRNPHGDYHKPARRDSTEIIADYKVACAKMLLNKIEKECS